jgi:hypothetical protein
MLYKVISSLPWLLFFIGIAIVHLNSLVYPHSVLLRHLLLFAFLAFTWWTHRDANRVLVELKKLRAEKAAREEQDREIKL